MMIRGGQSTCLSPSVEKAGVRTRWKAVGEAEEPLSCGIAVRGVRRAARDVVDDAFLEQFPQVRQEDCGALVQLPEVDAQDFDEGLVSARFFQAELREQIVQVAEGEEVLQSPEHPPPRQFQSEVLFDAQERGLRNFRDRPVK